MFYPSDRPRLGRTPFQSAVQAPGTRPTTAAALLVQPWRVRLAQGVGERLQGAGLLPMALSSERLLGSIWDPSWREELESAGHDDLKWLLDCLDADRRLAFLGRWRLRSKIVEGLRRRLLLRSDLEAYPQSLKTPIERPVFVVGLPRSGTTLLQNLLLQHPGCRWLRPWELEIPFPKSPQHWGGERDPRRRRYETRLHRLRRYHAKLDAIHPVDSPAECWQLLWPSFVCHTIFLFFGFQGYLRWSRRLAIEPIRAAYSFYRQHLQHLTWHQGGCHWVLKAPEHAIHLAVVLERFPDARIIHLHRDPAQVVPSLCSLAWHCQYRTVKTSPPGMLGRQVLEAMSAWSEKILASRPALRAEQIYDLHYRDLVEQPLATVAKIYDHFGMSLPRTMRAGINAWLDERHGARRPRHLYSLEQFGLRVGEVKDALAAYRDRFQIPLEAHR